jgi:hypothetical protein
MRKEIVQVKEKSSNIPRSTLNDMGFMLENGGWVMYIFSNEGWHSIVLPLNPTWSHFRDALVTALNPSTKAVIATQFLDECTESYYKSLNDKKPIELTKHLLNALNKLDIGE